MSKSAQKILDTAETLFYQQSINGVGVDLIRDQSGCSKTTMYTYFKNKNQLVQSVLLERDKKFRLSLESYIADAIGVDALLKIFDWHANWFNQDDYKGCLFVRAVAETSDDLDVIEISKNHKEWIRQLIEKNCSFSENTFVMSNIIYTLIEGLISRFLVEGYSLELELNTKNALNKIIISLS